MMTEDRCVNCGKAIDKAQPAFINKEKIVCQSCDTLLRDWPAKLTRPDDDHSFAVGVVFAAGVALAAELIAMVALIYQLMDNTLPDGPVEMALNQRLQAHAAAKIYIAVDAGLITVTLAVLMLAMILNVLTKIHHRQRLESLKPPLG
jgi:hypothetical protein